MIPVLSSNKFYSSENAESSFPEPSESNALLTKILPHHPREARSPTSSLHKDSCTLFTRFQKTSPFYEAFALMFFSSFSFYFIPVQMISWTSGWLRRSQFILWPAWGLSHQLTLFSVYTCVLQSTVDFKTLGRALVLKDHYLAVREPPVASDGRGKLEFPACSLIRGLHCCLDNHTPF